MSLPLALALSALGAPARAQWGYSAGASLGGTANGGTTKGDIVLPDGTNPDVNESDTFVRAAVGTELLSIRRNAAHQLTYNFAAFVHFQEGKVLSFSNDLLWVGTFNPLRDTELSLTGSVSQGRTGDLFLFNRVEAGDSVARPSYSTWFIGSHVAESFSWSPDTGWNITQDVSADAFAPLFDDSDAQPRTLGAEAHLGLARRWDNNGIGLRGGVGHGRSTAVRQEGLALFPAREANFANGLIYYDQTINDDWGLSLGVGGLVVQVPQVRDPFFDVSVDASLDYRTQTGGHASAYFSRAVATNVFVGDTMLLNGGGVRFTQFFGRDESWQVAGGADFQTGKSVFVVNEKNGGLDVFSLIASLNYEFTRHILLDLEGHYTYQNAEPSRRGTMFLPAYTLHRVMVMLSAAYVFPQPEKLTGGGGGRRRPRVLGRPASGEVRTGLEAVLDPARTDPVEAAGVPVRREWRETRSDRRDTAGGPKDEEEEPQLPPGSLPPR